MGNSRANVQISLGESPRCWKVTVPNGELSQWQFVPFLPVCLFAYSLELRSCIFALPLGDI